MRKKDLNDGQLSLFEPAEEKIIKQEYSDIMKQSYIDYAMSVIIARAVPDIRDGLKPVQRRILYDMGEELGLDYNKPYRKSARIVGDTMGKFHPHGDSSIYDAMVVMAQDFKREIPLVDGHGNFGSIEGDGAAASRYTEARLQKIAQENYLADLDKKVVDYVPNYDETEKEPEVLPVKIPNFLINGSEGIAVGMTTSTPSHNLVEVLKAEEYLIDNPDAGIEDLMEFVKGPDFPTGGIVANSDDILEIYKTGTGKIRVQGRVTHEKNRQVNRLVITEIPYTMIGAGIANFLNDVAMLVDSKQIPDIVDISNQSSKEGIKIVLDLKKSVSEEDAERIKTILLSKTKLEDTFGVNMLAIADGRPETLSLKSALEHHISFLFDVNQKKYTTMLAKENEKAEVQEYYVLYRELVRIKRELDAMITDETEKQRKIDLLSYQVQEIEDAGLTAGEEQSLESRRKILANASAIRDKIAQSYALLSGDDESSGAVDLLGEASHAIDTAAQLDDALATASSQLLDLYYNAKDVAADLIGRLDSYDTNDAELDEIEQRLDLIYKLKRKYGDTVEDVIEFGQNAREELERIQSSQERHDHLQAEKRRLYALAREKAEALTQTRLNAFEALNKRISGTLDFLNMPGVRMTLRHTRGPLASHGQDSIEFYISTNPGEAPKPLAKIASGGELSRITLAIKNAMADKDAVPTVIYDEIDSGVSGKAAGRIGEVLRQSAQGHQILCITHTAQIAALADCHLLIQKNVANDRTYTEIHPLDEEGRVEALARLISGDHVTDISRANAREMLGLGAQ